MVSEEVREGRTEGAWDGRMGGEGRRDGRIGEGKRNRRMGG